MYISAISNAACIHNNPFGYLVFGIDNDTHTVESTKFRFQKRKEGNSELEIWVRRLLSPSIKFEFFPCDYDGHYLEIFKIPVAVGEPTYFKNTPYIRFGSSLTDAVLLDKVQKSLPINDEAARRLKQKGFIEGRKPNYFISEQIAGITDKKAQYTRNKGLDTELLKSSILKHIEIHGSATRKELEDLLLDKMLDYMDEKQRRKRLDNILQDMRGDIIVNIGSRKISKWIKKKD